MGQAIIKTSTHHNEPCIEIRGSCDQGALDSLIKAFQKMYPKVREKLFIDVSQLTYADSSTLGFIMFHFNKLAQEQRRLVLLQPSDEVRQILRTTSLDRVLTVEA